MAKDDDDVGYGKPPKANQFRKGSSGNPAGRPKGAKGMQTTFQQFMSEKVDVIEGGKHRRMPRLEAMLRQLMSRAVAGDMKAMAEIMKLSRQWSEPVNAVPASSEDKTKDKALINQFLAQFQHKPKDSNIGERQAKKPEAKGERNERPSNIIPGLDDEWSD